MTSIIHSDIRNLVDFIEGQFLVTGEVPSASAISRNTFLPEDEVEDALKDVVVLAMLERRGINPQSNNMSPEMLACANVLLDFSDKRSKRDKLAALGITTQQYNAFKKNKQFNQYCTQRAEQLLGDSMDEAHVSLLKNVERGDVQSLKLYYEMTGRHNPAAAQQFNVESMLTRIFEIITTRVKDPVILEQIAQDMGTLAVNSRPQPQAIMGELDVAM